MAPLFIPPSRLQHMVIFPLLSAAHHGRPTTTLWNLILDRCCRDAKIIHLHLAAAATAKILRKTLPSRLLLGATILVHLDLYIVRSSKIPGRIIMEEAACETKRWKEEEERRRHVVEVLELLLRSRYRPVHIVEAATCSRYTRSPNAQNVSQSSRRNAAVRG